MKYKEAIEKLYNLYHKTRLTKDIYVPSEIIEGILYSEKNNDKNSRHTST